jgi:glycosyltransferase involved in cell wall biosynthesis
MKPLVSIALPVFNSERTIAQTLASIQGQVFKNWEAIIADDGSTDRTVEIVKAFSDIRFRLISDGRRLGISDRLNQIAGLAQGIYLARMDADDIMHPCRLERQLAAFNQNRELDVLGTDAYFISQSGELLGYYASAKPCGDPWEIALNGGFIHPTIMGRVEWFRGNPYSAEVHRAEDMELWMRTCQFSKFEILREPLLYYRRRAPRNIGPDWRSSRSVDTLILRCGAETNRVWQARAHVAARRLQFGALALNAFCGIRSLRWHLRSRSLNGEAAANSLALHASPRLGESAHFSAGERADTRIQLQRRS